MPGKVEVGRTSLKKAYWTKSWPVLYVAAYICFPTRIPSKCLNLFSSSPTQDIIHEYEPQSSFWKLLDSQEKTILVILDVLSVFGYLQLGSIEKFNPNSDWFRISFPNSHHPKLLGTTTGLERGQVFNIFMRFWLYILGSRGNRWRRGTSYETGF